MKSIFSKLIITLTLASLISTSCSIEKRRYSVGYHVEWHNNKSNLKQHAQKKGVTPDELVVSNVETDSVISIANDSAFVAQQQDGLAIYEKPRKRSIKKFEEKVIQNPVYRTFAEVTRVPFQKLGYSLKPVDLNSVDSEVVEKEVQIQGLLSILFGLLGLVMIGVLYSALASGGFLSLAVPFVIWLGAVIAGMVMGIWGTVEFGMEPEKYEGGFMGAIGIGLSVLSIILFITLIMII